jgi:hypothetical protein
MASFEIIEIPLSDEACSPVRELDGCEICGHCDLMRRLLRQKLRERPPQDAAARLSPTFPSPGTEV